MHAMRSRISGFSGVLALFVAVGILAGCTKAPPLPQYPELRYNHLPSINLAASELLVESQFKPSYKAPNVEHLFPQPPEKVASQWALDRLKPTGEGQGFIRFVIKDAAAVEEELARTTGLKGAFTSDQTERYTLTMDLAVQYLDERRIMRAEASAQGSRSRTIGEGASLNEREQLWFDMTEELMNALNKDLEQSIRTYMGPYLR